ncbi:MAG TPA: zinc-binding alcohol dehydrogenase [Nocardioides sp.]|nr:zinc-binding alcohol dehydrogenase [Nocardioides sp.]
MKRRNLVVPVPGEIQWVTEDLPDVPEGGLLLETVATGLSAGTELTFVKGDHPGLGRTHDSELGLFRDSAAAPSYPVTRLGYMEVARVARSRSAAFAEGSLVASAYGHATAHVSDPVREHVVPLPDDLDPILGVYVAHLGPICANGLLHAAAEAVGPPVRGLGDGVAGRRVLVTGAGLIGLLTALMAREHGAEEVAVVDGDPRRRAVAEALGMLALDETDDPALTLKTRWRHGPADHGADVAFQCRGRPHALATALRALRPQGAVVDLAFYTDGAAEVRLGEEFHHNGLSVRCAQIGRTPRGTSGHWDRARLSAETIRVLTSCGQEVRDHLVTDVVALEEAPRLMLEVARHERHVLSAIFTADDTSQAQASL